MLTRTCGPGVPELQVTGVLGDAVHVAEAVEAHVCPDAAGTWKEKILFFSSAVGWKRS